MSTLQRTSLYDEHKSLGGRLIDFGGWELPVQYSGVMDEHLACRKSVGIFDVSHMGEFLLEGPGAVEFLEFATTNSVSTLSIGQAQYTLLCNEAGGLVDDLVIYRRAEDRFLVVVNASNTLKDFEHLQSLLPKFGRKDFSLTNASSRFSQIAVQGRNAAATVQKITGAPLGKVKTYWFCEDKVLGEIDAVIARTGYTGEDGFEIYIPWDAGPRVWRALLEAGKEFNIKPCGLGARDTLRLEMKYPLYGHELSDTTNPISAGLKWVVKAEKPFNFVGKAAITAFLASHTSARTLVGFKPLERAIPRQGYLLFDAGRTREIGVVTSGTHSPSLGCAIGLAYVDSAFAKTGTKIALDVRGQSFLAEVVPTPFYKRPYELSK